MARNTHNTLSYTSLTKPNQLLCPFSLTVRDPRRLSVRVLLINMFVYLPETVYDCFELKAMFCAVFGDITHYLLNASP